MNPVAAGLMIAVVIATGVYGRHLETESQLHDTEYVTMKKWNQDRIESLQRQILDLRMNAG